jgi:hypothetical protein
MGVAYHAPTRHVVIFGGDWFCTEFTCWRYDTVGWNGQEWIGLHPSDHPSARSQVGMTYDSVRRRTILFGGGSPSHVRETWSWDGTDWTLLSPIHAPPRRWGPGMTWDGVRKEIVLFGGQTPESQEPLGDTWTWDGSDWTCVAGCP